VVAYAYRFWDTPSLTVALNDGQPGEMVVKIGDTETGFTIEVRDGAGSVVTASRKIDWNATGVGMQAAAPVLWATL
jgi:hypothetical protein